MLRLSVGLVVLADNKNKWATDQFKEDKVFLNE